MKSMLFRVSIIFSFSFSFVAFGWAQDRGLQVVAKTIAGADLQIGKQYAVLIGIDRYAEWASLRTPVKVRKI
jgi:hypothetical protein